MSAQMTVRPISEADLPAVLALLRSGLGPGPIGRDRRAWSWKHLESPFGPSFGWLAEVGGALVGVRMLLRWELRTAGVARRAVRAVDTLTHPDWRGRGVFTTLTRHALAAVQEEGVELVFNTPNRFSRPGYLKLGWRSLGRPPLLVRPLRLRAGGRRSPAAELPGAPIADFLAAPEHADLLAGWAQGDVRYHTERSRGYLGWRYRDVPRLEYRASWAREAEAAAALVYRVRTRSGRRELSLAEVLTSPGPHGRRLARRLLRELSRRADADYMVALAAKGTPERTALLSAGFLPLPFVGPIMTVHTLDLARDRETPDPCRWRSWRSSVGDLELF